jgi:hypothetical protein
MSIRRVLLPRITLGNTIRPRAHHQTREGSSKTRTDRIPRIAWDTIIWTTQSQIGQPGVPTRVATESRAFECRSSEVVVLAGFGREAVVKNPTLLTTSTIMLV